METIGGIEGFGKHRILLGRMRIGEVIVRSRRGLAVVATAGLLATACSESDPSRAAFLDSGCPRCHGGDLGGTRLGPPLTDLSRHWDAVGLERFLALPDSVRAVDKRVSRLANGYPGPMPTFEMSDSLRSTLAAYLLNPAETR